jgi:hypothetical protein
MKIEKKFSKVFTFRINDEEMYTTFERLRNQMGLSKSEATQEMFKNWVLENKKYDIQENLFNN